MVKSPKLSDVTDRTKCSTDYSRRSRRGQSKLLSGNVREERVRKMWRRSGGGSKKKK